VVIWHRLVYHLERTSRRIASQQGYIMIEVALRLVMSSIERRNVCLERRGSVHGCCAVVRVRRIEWVFEPGIWDESIVVVSTLGLVGLT